MCKSEIIEMLSKLPDEEVFIMTHEGAKTIKSIELCTCESEIIIKLDRY